MAAIYFVFTIITLFIISSIVTYGSYLLVNSVMLYGLPQLFLSIYSFLITVLVFYVTIKLSAFIFKKKFILKNALQVVKYAVMMFVALQALFLLRDFLIVEINGLPIVREYPKIIFSYILQIILFFYFTRKFLSEVKLLR